MLAMSAIPATSIAALDGTLGSIEIGGVVGTFLFGIITLQVNRPQLSGAGPTNFD
jgi:hypothetical protein